MKYFSLDKTEGVYFDMLSSTAYMCGYSEELMMTKVRFEKGNVVAPHHWHKHAQFTHIIKGSIQITDEFGNKGPVMHAGDTVYFAPNEKHSLAILEDDTWLYDVFNPGKVELMEAHFDKVGIVKV